VCSVRGGGLFYKKENPGTRLFWDGFFLLEQLSHVFTGKRKNSRAYEKSPKRPFFFAITESCLGIIFFVLCNAQVVHFFRIFFCFPACYTFLDSS
jgi:hypothetical protein